MRQLHAADLDGSEEFRHCAGVYVCFYKKTKR
jgi:hypothetical protein